MSKQLKNILFIGVLSSVFFVRPVMAQEIDYFSLEPEQLLKAEIISVSKKRETVADAPAAIYVITQEDIRRSGVITIPEALRLAPGVQVARSDSNSWAVSIRGFNGGFANKLLVMIDGRSIYNPLFAGTYWELQDYMLEDIERIEVIRGPGGAVWGANAVNGVINVITKKASSTQGNLVSALYGNEEQGTLSARHGGTFGFNKFYRAYTKYFNRDSFRRPGGEDATDEWQGGRAGFRADWGEDFTLQGDVYRVLTDQLTRTPLLTAPFALSERETMDSQGANILGRWTKDMGAGALLTTQAYVDYTARDQILLRDRRGVFDFETQYNFSPAGRHEVIAGAGYRFMADDLGSAPSVTFAPKNRNDNLFSVFAQDKITLAPGKWYLTLGSKFEHNDYTGFEIQPNIRLQYHPDSSQMLWGAISRAVRTPSRLEHDLTNTLTVWSPGTRVVLNANPDFDSEKLVAYEAGYRKQVNKDFSVDMVAFFNDYDDLSTYGFLPTSPGLFPVETVNGMKSETWGLEIAPTWNVTDQFKITGGYSLLDMFLHVSDNGGFNLETAEGTSPHHQANLRAYWDVSETVSFNSAVYYVDQLSTSNVDDYVRLDLNLSWHIKNNIRFDLVGHNLLNEAHREFSTPTSLNASEVERSVFGKVTWEF